MFGRDSSGIPCLPYRRIKSRRLGMFVRSPNCDCAGLSHKDTRCLRMQLKVGA